MIQIFIPTHKRPKWCLNLLKELKKESKGLDYNVHILHDRCDSDYSKVVKYCNQNKEFHYWLTRENMGKWGFWRLNNMMYSILDTLDYDYFIQLVDDITIVKNFTRRAVELMNYVPACRLTTPFRMQEKIKIPKELKDNWIKTKDNYLRQSNVIDCSFVATRDVMQGIRLGKFTQGKNELLGSGTATMWRDAYTAKTGEESWQAYYSLYDHLGYEKTVMHNKLRRTAVFGEIQNQKDPLRNFLHKKDRDYVYKKFNKLING